MANLQNYKEDFILLCEAGFVAVNQFDEDAALKLFKASQILSPENTLPLIGIGYLHLCKLELKQACDAFKKVLEKEPHNDMAKAFLGIAHSLNPNETMKGEKILEETVHSTHDQQIKTLANTAIDFVEKFVKKSPTPVQAQKSPPKKK